MRTGTILKLLMTVILTAASLSACSLDQRGQDGLVRIQLNTRAHSGGPSRLGTLTGGGMTAPTANSFYVIDVEGEGIPRQIIEPSKCVKASPTSSAMVPALLQPGEAERTELELLVPVGANRKVKIVRVDLNIPAGSSSPQFGESPFRFKMRNPGYSVSGDMFVLAEATIPFLNGDQSVTLIEKAVPEAIPNLCQAQGNNQPPIANADVELLKYEPWEGLGPNGQINPYRAWNNTPHYLMVRGEVKNKGASPLGFPAWPNPSSTPSATLDGLGIGWPNGYFSRQTLNSQESGFYQWVFPNYSPAPTGATPSQVQITLPYSGGSSPSIVHSFPWVMHSTPAPISNPVVSQVAGYANLYKARLDFTRNGSVIPVRPYGSLYSAVNTQYDLSPFEARGTLDSFAPDSGATALALNSDETIIFVATPGKFVKRYNITQAPPAAPVSSVTLVNAATALQVVGTKVLIADQTQFIRAFDYTLASPTPVPVYDGGTGAAFKGMVLDSAGGLVLSDSARHVLLRLTPTQLNSALGGTAPAPGSATLLAGEVGTMGNVDGPLLPTARFKNPGAMARDASGNILLVDGGNMSIRRVVVGGSVTTLPSPVAAFAYGNPSQIAMRGDSVLVSDSSRHVVYRIPPSGSPEILVGKYGSNAGSATSGLLLEDSAQSSPSALATGASGSIYIGDSNKVRRAMAPCPVQKDMGGVPPRPFNAGKGCEFFYRVYNGSAFAPANHPIMKIGLRDGSGLEGYYTPQLSLAGHTYPSGYVGEGNDLVYNPTLASALTVTQADVTAPGGWILPSMTGNTVTIEGVSIRSDSGTSTNVGMVTLSSGTLELSSRMVNGAPIRELEILVKAVPTAGGSIAFYKQRFSFVPVIPANATSRLSIGIGQVAEGFQVSTSCASWQIQAYYQGRSLPVASGSLANFGVNTYSATPAGVISFTPATVGTLSITNAVAKYKSLDGDVGAPAASWSGTVVSSLTCSLNAVAGAVNNVAN